MFIKFFKDRSNKKFIERILETRSRNFTNEKIETVGIILNINEFNDFEKIKSILRSFGLNENKVKFITYLSKKCKL